MIRSFNSSEGLLSENTTLIPRFPINKEIVNLEEACLFWEEFKAFWTKRQKSTGYPAYNMNYDMSAWTLMIQEEKNKIPFLENEVLDNTLTLRKIECVSYFLMEFIKRNAVEEEIPKEVRFFLSTSSDGDRREMYLQIMPLVKEELGYSVYSDTSHALTSLFNDNKSPLSCLSLALTEEIKQNGYGFVALDTTSIKTIQDSIAESLKNTYCYDLKNQRDLLRDVKKIANTEQKVHPQAPTIHRF